MIIIITMIIIIIITMIIIIIIYLGLNSRWRLGRYTWPRDCVSITTPMAVSPYHHSPLNK